MKRCIALWLCLVFLCAPGALAQNWVDVSSIRAARDLPEDADSVRLIYQGHADDHLLLAALAEHRPDLHRLSLVARGRANIRPLQPLEQFTELRHLELHEGVSNFCYVDPKTGVRELDAVSRLTKLRTLVLDTF